MSIGGAFLGSAKAYAYPVTGEMTESIGLGAAFAAMLEKHGGLGRTSVAELTRTWASVPALLPRGGSAYWSTNGTFLTIEKPSPDVLEALRRDASSSTVARALLDRVADGAELSVDGALDLLRAMLPACATRVSLPRIAATIGEHTGTARSSTASTRYVRPPYRPAKTTIATSAIH